jgi:GAF domain-containing protein
VAEETLDVRALPKPEAYRTLSQQIESVLEGVDDPVAAMATMSCVLHQGLGHLWTGFYRVVSPRLLRVGPYQGTLGCLEIPFGKGVCGAVAERQQTVVVEDVHQYAGHIACDARSRSEIVVPVFNRRRELIAVLDIDSEKTATFDDTDHHALEALMGWFGRHIG